jgi:glycosyltransferase involved in cell wall biosynthesis
MRILHVITRGDEAGGAQTHVRDLAIRQAADGHEVTVATGAFGALTDALDQAGVPAVFAPGLLRAVHPIHDSRAIASLRAIIKANRPEIVSTHSSKAGIIGRIAAKTTGTPCLYTVHGWAFNSRTPQPARRLYQGIERGTGLLSSRIICVSDFDRALGERGGISGRKLTTVHNGLPDVEPHLRAAHANSGEPRFISVARFAEPKDFPTLIAAMRGLAGMHLDLVGDGPLLDETRALAATLGVADRVHFLGRRADVPALLAAADGFVLSSHSEGFPISTLEAMRAGLPVIVSRVGGAPEAVNPGVTGFVSPPADADALRARLAELASSAARRRAMGAAGRARFVEWFSFERMYARTMGIYAELARESAVVTLPPRTEEGHRIISLPSRTGGGLGWGAFCRKAKPFVQPSPPAPRPTLGEGSTKGAARQEVSSG